MLHLTANGQHILDSATEVIAACSFLHTVLPPWDWSPDFVSQGLSEFPAAQKIFYGVFHNRYYRLLIYVIGFIALNGRSTIWKFISVKNPEGPNASIPTIVHAANVQAGSPESAPTEKAVIVAEIKKEDV